LDAYEQRLRSLLESRGAVRARHRYSVRHFEWFALWQLGGLSTTKLLKQYGGKGDESTILKGLKKAADLVQWTNIRNSPKRKSGN
jgi:hypothetical protein